MLTVQQLNLSFFIIRVGGNPPARLSNHIYMYLSLEEAKDHLNVEHDEDDVYIMSLIETAEEQLANCINRPFSEVLKKDGTLPTPLRHAIKILAARLYAYREGDVVGRVQEASFTLANLFMPYRREL